MPQYKSLSATFVKRVKDVGWYGDGRGGHGLTLVVQSRDGGGIRKSWVQRLTINGKRANIGLGPFPVVTLAEARAQALENRRAAYKGLDPRNPKSSIPTFEQAADTVIRLNAPTWKDGGKTAKRWLATLEQYAFPRIGSKAVDKVTTGDVLAVLLPIWNDKRETASQVRSRMRAVLSWAVAQGYRQDNPAGDAIKAALPRNGGKVNHQRALPHAQVGAALETIRASNAWPLTVLAFEFLTLTATRSGEVRAARWSEIDLEARTWTIPADRMKAGVEHTVPLSSAALDVLKQAEGYRDTTGLIFPSQTGRVMSDSTISKLVRENGIGCVPHGMRSSFRDWCGEASVDRELAESALAHTVKDAVEAAYFRTSMLERRRVVMDKLGSVHHGLAALEYTVVKNDCQR